MTQTMKNKEITLGLIAARKGSVSVKKKNLLKIKNQEITKIALKLAIKCPIIDSVILSTDSNKILNLIKKNKKLIKLKRNKSLAKNNTPMLPVMKNAITFFEKIKKKKISKLVIFDPTSPLRSMEDIQNAIKNFNPISNDIIAIIRCICFQYLWKNIILGFLIISFIYFLGIFLHVQRLNTIFQKPLISGE